ncbi:MAG TPA: PolC-type DNA polymerase III, partial [Ruminococcus sp.]|nr:PolC-type DNA polymerase III [Ruminococcus sp.]
MNTYTIESFFENYKELIPSVIEKGRILRLGYNEENGTFTCQAAFDKLVPFESTVEFEMKMRAALGAGKFILQLKYTPDMLCAEYFPELCKFLKSRFPLVNGFFDNAEAVYENGIFTVDIKHGGEALLKKAGIETAFPALTMELFSVRADIRLTGVLETDMEEHQREQEEFLNSLPVPKIDPAQPEKKAAVTTNTASGASVDFRTANVDFTRFSLLCDDALVLMGAPISGNEQVMQMKDIPADYRGRVVVWGDIFGPVETKETKSGMLIAHLNFTDYTSSNSIKFIGSNKNFRNMKGLKRAVLEAMLEHLKAGKTILVAGEIEEDDFDHSINIKPDSIMVVKREKEKDTCEHKRVELHCHTNMSMMDALTPAGKLVE